MRGNTRLTVVTIVSCLTVASCGGGGTVETFDSQAPRTTTIAPRSSDGILRLGLLTPRSGSGATIGEPLVAITKAAVDLVNRAGGVNGVPVELVVEDEGGDTSTALAAIDSLMSARVDAVIGPMSSPIALSTLSRLITNGLGVCSPAATSASLTNFPDRGMFVRTSPSDSLAALAIAQEVARTGVRSTVLAFPDDPFGRDFAVDVRRALGLEGITIAGEIPFNTGDDEYSDDLATTAPNPPAVITLIGDRESGARFLSSILNNLPDSSVVVNDALADADFSTDPVLETGGLSRVVGVAVDSTSGFSDMYGQLRTTGFQLPPGPPGPDPFVATDPLPVPFATATVDCVNLLALSAAATATDDPTTFMAEVIPTSRGGSACDSFAECASLLVSALNIDYDGPTNMLALSPNGDPSMATFVTFGFGENGKAEYRSAIGVVSAP